MIKFTGIEYLYIDIANQYGLDKENWADRINWTNVHLDDLEDMISTADEPILYAKAVRALRDSQKGIATGYIMSLDATASGLQCMAALIGCPKTASMVNLINTGNREDVYSLVAKKMSEMPDVQVDRDTIKKPVMTTFYGSKRQPKSVFGEDTPELQAFYDILNTEMEGAMVLLGELQALWDPQAMQYTWTMPDGHVVVAKVMDKVDKKIEVDEISHATFTHRFNMNRPTDFGVSLAANIVHSVDGYVVREMIRRCDKAGFQMAAIHDSFWASPNHMNEVRQFFLDILVEIAEGTLMSDIINEIYEPGLTFNKLSSTLPVLMLDAEYALS